MNLLYAWLHRGCDKATADRESVLRELQARCARLDDEQGQLADVARRQTERAETLADDLLAADHRAEEIEAACSDLEYALTEADIPNHLRDRLDQLRKLTDEHQEVQEQFKQSADRYLRARDHMLAAAHAAGTLARTYALAEGAHMTRASGDAEQTLAGVQTLNFVGFSTWGCQSAVCLEDTRELVWHESAPERAHLACRCGRVWQAGAGAVERAERETRTCEAWGTSRRTLRRWSQISGPTLEAIDRALPGPDELRLVEVEADVVTV
ncbi:hypothetical protein [Nocardiopsis sp. NRRL B-16309]|uniref:hypothetical protein n=1 Tax=Nocardiopsis sp. NRRL B-16309 TaxID=1519494 RepID=UPI0006AFEA48|nr:hypothetical protein [Nocardiopsis sp. NRRL B-16309]